MNATFSDEHLAFRDMVHKWVDAEVPKSWARELERDEHQYPFALWDKFTQAGFHGIGIDEKYGGQGGDIITQMIWSRAC
jgi:acyl-CoA dehydrogenase